MRLVVRLLLEHQAHRGLTHLGRAPALPPHFSILSSIGGSGRGEVHIDDDLKR